MLSKRVVIAYFFFVCFLNKANSLLTLVAQLSLHIAWLKQNLYCDRTNIIIKN